jgi:hypothetical protein
MGRDKTPKSATDAGKDAPPTTSSAATAVGGRGHRQRGAGTVIVAKAPVITQDGIVLKPHERLPTQLLQEYCQREKRPNPKYMHMSGSGHRYRILLEDSKNAKNDLIFVPVQSSESDKIARDYAALLALFHFQKNMPLERKLPGICNTVSSFTFRVIDACFQNHTARAGEHFLKKIKEEDLK